MPNKGQKIEELTNMQKEVLAMFQELGGSTSSYGLLLHAKRTRPSYGHTAYFQANVDNRITQLKKRGYVKYNPRDGKWHLIKRN